MKVGIVTFWGAPNYGAMLQALALWRVLVARGHEVKFVNYDFCKARRPSFLKCFATCHIKVIKERLSRYVRHAITTFSDRYPATRRIASYSDLVAVCADFEVIIVGSDQVWNPAWFSGTHLSFVMLDFAPPNCKRIACSASFGTQSWSMEQNSIEAGRLLRKFAAISVRENSGVDLVRQLSGRSDAQCLIDPTALLTSKDYMEVAKPVVLLGRGHSYVFTYFLNEWSSSTDCEWMVKKVKNLIGVVAQTSDLIPVEGLLRPICYVLGVRQRIKVEGWLNSIGNSSFVCTNSFHGTVFSLLFHRPFVTLLIKGKWSGMNERVVSLLKIVGLENRAIHPGDLKALQDAVHTPIDWHYVDEKLIVERKKYALFLNSVGF